MQIINLAVLAATLATVGALPWFQDANGVWVANNAWWDDLNGVHKVHEACAERDGSSNHGDGALCAYATDANGGIFNGCDGGICEFGYAACLQKFGCSGQSGQADCIGLATATLS
ncbi:hypothetical protein AALT_g11889 [Alternaria alternata]|nr:hypothetical protein AALT_g11889 [Alternaria alternata]